MVSHVVAVYAGRKPAVKCIATRVGEAEHHALGARDLLGLGGLDEPVALKALERGVDLRGLQIPHGGATDHGLERRPDVVSVTGLLVKQPEYGVAYRHVRPRWDGKLIYEFIVVPWRPESSGSAA
jgi:hypothetical protein